MEIVSRGWQMTEKGAALQRMARTIDTSRLEPGEAVVEVAGCGVCHTDLGFLYDGVRTKHAYLRRLLEYAGEEPPLSMSDQTRAHVTQFRRRPSSTRNLKCQHSSLSECQLRSHPDHPGWLRQPGRQAVDCRSNSI